VSGGACRGGLEGRMASVATPSPLLPSSPLPTAMVAWWSHLAAMRWVVAAMQRAKAREGQPGRPSGLSCSPSSLLAEFLLFMVAKSANSGSERARVVASTAVRWPSSWMAEAMELGCNRCFCVQWR
jgi:hypothetical protein